MASKTEQKRADLRARLVEIAEAWIVKDGLSNIKARPLAAEAGCAVGAIYNVFGDMNELIMAVNSRTFARLGKEVGEKGQDPALAPQDALVTLAHAYLQFAIENPKAWRTLFDLDMRDSDEVPEWYRQELAQLMGYIAGPVGRLFPELDEEDTKLMARSLFSAVHGIITLGLENRISGVPQDRLAAMIEMMLRRLS